MKDILLALIDRYEAAVKAGDAEGAERLKKMAMQIVKGV